MNRLLPPKIFYCQKPIFASEKINPMEVKSLFEKAVDDSKTLSQKPSNETLLQLYSLYKQATEGDVNVEPPSNAFDFVAKAKFEAYINLVNKLKS
jgi:diazepam-binding inhibitor (GABA receptor modulator, acyl-CoA-binding protein)